jgi:hypothetical protein
MNSWGKTDNGALKKSFSFNNYRNTQDENDYLHDQLGSKKK